MERSKLPEPNNQNDEIDLTKVVSSFFSFLGKIFRGILKFLFHFIDKVFSNKKLIFSLLVIGALLGAAYFFITKPYYESRMSTLR